MENNVKKPVYKKWWFWVIIVIILIGAAGGSTNNNSNNGKYQKDTSVEVTIADFSMMTEDTSKVWFDTNKMNGGVTTEYSDTVAKDGFISQSIPAGTVAHQGDTLKVIYSLGKEPTIEQKNALRKAESYSSTMNMSKQGIYNQLTSSFEGFSAEDAQYAVDNLNADYNANALAKAKSYQQTMSMSKNAIYNQLTSTFEGFTAEQAQYAIDHLDN